MDSYYFYGIYEEITQSIRRMLSIQESSRLLQGYDNFLIEEGVELDNNINILRVSLSLE